MTGGNDAWGSIVFDGPTAFVASERNVYRSDDFGATWVRMPMAGIEGLCTRAIARVSTGLYVTVNGPGVFRFDDGTKSWTWTMRGIDGTGVVALIAVGNRLYAGCNGLGVFRSDDGGRTWIRCQNPDAPNSTAHRLAAVGTTVFSYTDNGVFRSRDGGDSWERGGLKGTSNFATAGGRMWALRQHRLAYSDDLGDTWNPSRLLKFVNDVSVSEDGVIVVAKVKATSLHVSLDGGAHWIARDIPYYNNRATIHQGVIFAGSMSSEDGGRTWEPITDFRFRDVQSYLSTQERMYAATERNFSAALLYESTDGGLSWHPAMDVQNVRVNEMAAIGDNIYAATFGHGVMRRAPQSSDQRPIPPQGLGTGKTYPNPLVDESRIPFELVVDADVAIVVRDIAGQIVRQIPLGLRSAGSYTSRDTAASWDGRNELGEPVANGKYFYTLTAGSDTLTGSIVVRR